MFQGKRVLVTGGTGLIGRPLVDMLLERGAKVVVASLDHPSRANPRAEFKQVDLTRFENCRAICEGVDIVFHLAAIKGSPAATIKRPASFFVPTLMMNTNMMEAARQAKVSWYQFTSTVGVYPPAEVFVEDDVWTGFPSPADKFAGWAKRMGELQAEAYAIEHGLNNCSIVRPANVYGAYDNFDPANAMVVPSLIRRAVDGEDPFVVWGDGSPIRDFIHARDVARGMIMVVEKGITQPVNLASGKGITIRELVEAIVANLDHKPKVVWDTSKPMGDKKRVMDTRRAETLVGFRPEIPLEQWIKEVMDWYRANKGQTDMQYNIFSQRSFDAR
jgi:GDP-L-fucose synthase